MSNARLSILQAKAVGDERISDAQFRTLAALGCYGDQDGWCFPGLKTLGGKLHKSSQAVSKDIGKLVEFGYIEKHPRFDKDGSQKSNLYRLKFDTPSTPKVEPPSTIEIEGGSTPEVEHNDPINDPSNEKKDADASAPPPEPKAADFPEVAIYRTVTKRFPSKELFEKVSESIKRVGWRLGREATAEDLSTFFKEWQWRGYNKNSCAWLEWAESGVIPQNGNWKAKNFPLEPKAFTAVREYVNSLQEVGIGNSD